MNYTDKPEEEVPNTNTAFVAEDDWGHDEETLIQSLAETGDADAVMVAEFEDQIIEAIQDNADLSMCFSAYTDARARVRDRIKSRGFWPPKIGKGKGKGGKTKGGFHLSGRNNP